VCINNKPIAQAPEGKVGTGIEDDEGDDINVSPVLFSLHWHLDTITTWTIDLSRDILHKASLKALVQV